MSFPRSSSPQNSLKTHNYKNSSYQVSTEKARYHSKDITNIAPFNDNNDAKPEY